jgi:hypothetical protein
VPLSFHQNEVYDLNNHAMPIDHNLPLLFRTLGDSNLAIQDVHSWFVHTNQKIYFASLQDTLNNLDSFYQSRFENTVMVSAH